MKIKFKEISKDSYDGKRLKNFILDESYQLPITSIREAHRFDDSKGNRFYWFVDNGSIVIASGITSFLDKVVPKSEFIDIWKENNKNWEDLLNWAATYGTIEHGIFEDISKTGTFNKDQVKSLEDLIRKNGGSYSTPTKDILAYLKFIEDVKINPIFTEKILVWKCPKTEEYLAMTADMLATIETPTKDTEMIEDGVYTRGKNKGQKKYKKAKVSTFKKEVVCIDYKSNFFEKDKKSYYESHKMQLIGTKRAFEQNLGIKVDRVFNWSPNNWKKEPTYTFYEHIITPEDERLFDLYWEIAVIKGYHKPQGRILVSDLNSSSDYKYYSYEEYVRKFLLK